MNKIGETIKKLRNAKGITQDELAEAVNVSYQAVSKWENGGSPDLEMLPILANYFGVTIDELMGFKLAEFFAGRIEKLKEIADVKIAALVAIVDRGEGAKFMKEQYGADTLTVITGNDISSAISRGIV